MLNVNVIFERLANDKWQAISEYNETAPIKSPVIGTIEETLGGLRQALPFPDYRLRLTCIKCGNTESREYGVSEETGICEFCLMTPEQKRAIAKAEREEEEYVYGPPDIDYPPDQPTMPY